jgi:arylsulfatase A-like enzyme
MEHFTKTEATIEKSRSASKSRSQTNSNKPNLIFIFSDEQRFDTYGDSAGNLDMPNLTHFAQESTVFDQTYCTSPVCTPSRGAILTGMYPHAHGAVTNNVPLHAHAQCLPELIQSIDPDLRNAYTTGYVGKWHLGDEIFPQHGFDHWISLEDEYIPWYSSGRDTSARSSYYHFLESQGVTKDADIYTRDYCARLSEELGKPHFVASQARDFIETHQHNPFILYVNFLEPHMPFFGPRDYQYTLDQVTFPDNMDAPQHSRWEQCLAQLCYHRGESHLPLKTNEDWKVMIRNYWGLNSLVDYQFGRIIQRLKELDLYNSSIIVFTSDHGDMMGSHRMIAKQVMYEESARVPMMIKLPGQNTPVRLNQPVSQINLVPTLLDALGIPQDRNSHQFHGQSLFQELKEQTLSQRDVLVSWYPPEVKNVQGLLFQGAKLPIYPTRTSEPLSEPQGSYVILEPEQEKFIPDYLSSIGTGQELLEVFTAHRRALITGDGRWKLVVSTDGDMSLFDLVNDPGEWTNVFEVHPRVVKDLSHRLLTEMQRVADPMVENVAQLFQQTIP